MAVVPFFSLLAETTHTLAGRGLRRRRHEILHDDCNPNKQNKIDLRVLRAYL
jgi:hypothetical protein